MAIVAAIPAAATAAAASTPMRVTVPVVATMVSVASKTNDRSLELNSSGFVASHLKQKAIDNTAARTRP